MDPILTVPLAVALTVGGFIWRTSARHAKAEARIERALSSAKGAHTRLDEITPPVDELRRRAARDDERWTHVQSSLERIEKRLR